LLEEKSMKAIAFSFFTAIAVSSSAQADATAMQIPVTRGGETKTRVSYQFWSGEYPGPVIDVGGSNKGMTIVKAHRSLRNPGKPVNCEIKNGLYHPWSHEKNSVLSYYTVVATYNYLVLQDTLIDNDDSRLDPVRAVKGSSLQNVVYYGENICGGTIVNTGARAEVSFSCEIVDDKLTFKKTTPNDAFVEQWIHINCADSTKAFVQADALLKQRGVKRGDIADYGKVKRVR